ncbi:Periodic tryptophan protein 2 homolog [Seminavis robusta]|uniref:Periodic tryptophan protein 2 homolog n=1 Tax=Seminavis robusta TaxID=568900 RepID=A0A9N8DBP6_9STRA|nr:Periodic tryptophan protein 2 homolog [Seminavis robusta]|eukprot:Sro26_g017620.1 Periodic tryptophan protein 2 homolog (915) ;mRNA; r:72125-75193
MKFNYKLQRLCGAYYGHPSSTTHGTVGSQWGGANLVFSSAGNVLISAVANRVQVLDLQTHSVRTLPIEARSNIRCLALSPDDALLLVVDVDNYAMMVNFRRGIALHRFRFKHRVRQAVFSPNGLYLAVTHGKHVQVWLPPNHHRKEFAPMVLHRTYTGQSDDITCLTWSPDSSVLLAGSRDCTARIWTVNTTRGYEPSTLSGHKTPLVGVFVASSSTHDRIQTVFTISEDGALVSWTCTYDETLAIESLEGAKPKLEDVMEEAVDFFSGGALTARVPQNLQQPSAKSQAHHLVKGTWSIESRHYFRQDGARVTSTSYSPSNQLLSVGFSSGVFGLYEMPSVSNIHTLSVGSQQLVKTCTLNKTGDWLALGCPTSQQLLVWEWRSETYVLKQRGHAYGMRCMAYSPDGIVLCTGGEDGKLKLWNASSGFCYVTMEKSHTAPITAVCFAKASVVLSASLDGTVRAHDLHRYRTFKTLTTPTPVQFLSLAVDPSGEIVTAGSSDPFHIYVWNLQSGKILDVFSGHAGPVCGLAFQNSGGTLASASWDGTVKTWDLYKGNVPTESLQHSTDVVCVDIRPDGKEICSGSIGGLLSFWDVETAKLKYEIDGRRDIAGGRKMNDRMTANNNAASRYFTSVCYSADGACVLAGGNSKYVCIYEVSQQMLLKKFQVTFNRSLDGVLDELNSKNLGDGGPMNMDDADAETGPYALQLPGAKRGDDGSRSSRVEVLTLQVAFSSTGREWATVSMEGLHVYSLDEDMIFDPISLTEAVTPSAVFAKIRSEDYSTGLRMAVHLNEFALVKEVLDSTPYRSIPHVVRTVGPEQLERLMQFLSKILSTTPHIDFFLRWCLQLLQVHGAHLEKHRAIFMRAFRALHKAIASRQGEVMTVSQCNRYDLEFITDQAALKLTQHSGAKRERDE